MKQSVTILPLEEIPREPSGRLALLARRGVQGAVFQLCHQRRAWMRLLPPHPLLSSVAADGIRPARAEQTRSGTEKQGARATKVQPLPPACERIRGPARWAEAGRRPRAPPPCRPFLPFPPLPPLHITSMSWPRSPLLLFFTEAGAGTRRGPLFLQPLVRRHSPSRGSRAVVADPDGGAFASGVASLLYRRAGPSPPGELWDRRPLPCSAACEGRPASSTATSGRAQRGEASQWGGLQL
jgi:hypothetical protein